MIKLKEFLDTCDFVPYLTIYTLEEEGPVFEGDAKLLYKRPAYKQLLTSSIENWGNSTDIRDRMAFWVTLDVIDFIPFDESYKSKEKLAIKESDDKITAKNFQELIDKLEDHGYSCGHYYDVDCPDDNWLYITKNGDPYEAEFYRYSDGEYELYLRNIHPTKERTEGCHGKKTKKKSKRIKEDSYDDILQPKTFYIRDVWDDDLYDINDYAETLGFSMDQFEYDGKDLKITYDAYDRLGYEKCAKLYNWYIENIYPEHEEY